jgi:hypothetical protein
MGKEKNHMSLVVIGHVDAGNPTRPGCHHRLRRILLFPVNFLWHSMLLFVSQCRAAFCLGEFRRIATSSHFRSAV